jgi:hypothetical protein
MNMAIRRLWDRRRPYRPAVLGTVDYALSPSWNLHLGYRSLNFNISGSEGSVGFNVHMRGPITAGTFRF